MSTYVINNILKKTLNLHMARFYERNFRSQFNTKLYADSNADSF